jgi:hypothetical protein
MGQQIRKLIDKADGEEILRGHVEIDEAYVGGHRPGKRGRGAAGKTIVMGMKERDGRIERGGRVGLNSVSVPIDGFPANYLHQLPWWGVA